MNSFIRTSAMSTPQQIAAAAYIVIHYSAMKKKKRKSPCWWMSKLYTSREHYSGTSLLADLKFQPVSGLYKNFTRMHPTDFEFLLASIEPKISKQDTTFRKAIPTQERLALTLRFLATGDSYASLQYLFKISKQAISRIVPEVCGALVEALKDYIQDAAFNPLLIPSHLPIGETQDRGLQTSHKRLHHHHHSSHNRQAEGADSWGSEWESRSPAVWPQGNWPTETTATPISASIPPTPPPPPPGFATSAPLVRAEEALIVLIVLLLWIGAIALFFNRWGKIRMLEPYQPKFQQAAQHRPSCPLAAETPAAPIMQFRSLSKFNLDFECVNPSLRPRQNSVFANAVFSPTFNPPRKAKSALDIQTLVMTDEQHLLQQLDSIDSSEYPIRVTKV